MSPPESSGIFVTFWGTRGSISTPGIGTKKYGGNTPCVSIRYQNTDIIFDAGTGLRNLGLSLVQQSQKQKTGLQLHLLLSHTHWDHIQGLPFFAPAYIKGTKLTIYGSPQKERFLDAILQGQMDLNYFPVDMNAFAADVSIMEISGDAVEIGSVTINWQEQVFHPGGSVRYRVSASGKRVVYATDVELNKIFQNPESPENKSFAQEYRRFIHGADLLIADGQYTEDEYLSKVGWGHTTMSLLAEIAYKENVKQLAVFHHEPLHSDAMLDKIWPQYFSRYSTSVPPMNVFWAREGMTLAV